MILFTALALLAVVALLLLCPEHPTVRSLRQIASHHRLASSAIVGLLLIVLCSTSIWSRRGHHEVDEQGYAEVWYMVQTNPLVRPLARRLMQDGSISHDELQEVRKLYRDAPDKEAMRAGVVQELSNRKE